MCCDLCLNTQNIVIHVMYGLNNTWHNIFNCFVFCVMYFFLLLQDYHTGGEGYFVRNTNLNTAQNVFVIRLCLNQEYSLIDTGDYCFYTYYQNEKDTSSYNSYAYGRVTRRDSTSNRDESTPTFYYVCVNNTLTVPDICGETSQQDTTTEAPPDTTNIPDTTDADGDTLQPSDLPTPAPTRSQTGSSGAPTSEFDTKPPTGYPTWAETNVPAWTVPTGYPTWEATGVPAWNVPTGYPTWAETNVPAWTVPTGYPTWEATGVPAWNIPTGYPTWAETNVPAWTVPTGYPTWAETNVPAWANPTQMPTAAETTTVTTTTATTTNEPTNNPTPNPTSMNTFSASEEAVGLTIDHNAITESIIDTTGIPDPYIESVKVYLNISHQYIGDMIISLTHGVSNKTVILRDKNCGCHKNNINAVIEDDAELSFCAECEQNNCALCSNDGYFGYQPLAAFRDESPNTNWVCSIACFHLFLTFLTLLMFHF